MPTAAGTRFGYRSRIAAAPFVTPPRANKRRTSSGPCRTSRRWRHARRRFSRRVSAGGSGCASTASGHSVLGVIAVEPQPREIPARGRDAGARIRALRRRGHDDREGGIDDPRVIHGPLPLPGEPETGHALQTLESGDYLIGIPEGADARRLRIRRSEVDGKGGGRASSGSICRLYFLPGAGTGSSSHEPFTLSAQCL